MKNQYQTKHLLVINLIKERHGLLNSLVDIQQIWHPEWKHFSVIRASDTYILFENTKTVFYSTSYGTVMMELIERMHFHELKIKPKKNSEKSNNPLP